MFYQAHILRRSFAVNENSEERKGHLIFCLFVDLFHNESTTYDSATVSAYAEAQCVGAFSGAYDQHKSR